MNFNPFKKAKPKPVLLPDLGMHMYQVDFLKFIPHYFSGIPIDHIYFIDAESFSLCFNYMHEGGEFCMSIDLTMDQAVFLVHEMGPECVSTVLGELAEDGETPRKIELPRTVEMNFVCHLGSPIATLNEVICPFLPIEISRAKPSPTT